jgi:hypothetical protein
MSAGFEEVWALREDSILPALVGPLDGGIVTLDQVPSLVAQYEEWDPLWNQLGVMRSPPSPDRATTIYVTSGLTTHYSRDSPAAQV